MHSLYLATTRTYLAPIPLYTPSSANETTANAALSYFLTYDKVSEFETPFSEFGRVMRLLGLVHARNTQPSFQNVYITGVSPIAFHLVVVLILVFLK